MKTKFLDRFGPDSKQDKNILTITLLVLALILGIVVRWNFISPADYPINDGGFFYAMISDLVENDFRLPAYVSYNLDQIPYSYPPLAFYVVGALNKITGIALIELLRYLPFVISVFSIPAFYGVTRIFFKDEKFYRALATFLFATLPRSFEWFVMGGGITRSFGLLFALLAINFYAGAVRQNGDGRKLIAAIIFSSLTILSHPVAGLFLAFSILMISFYFWPIKIIYPFILGGLVICLTSPWWITVLKFNGLAPFLGASNTGHLDWFEIRYLLTQNFDFENRFFLPWVSVLAIVGLFSRQKRKALFLGLLVGLGYLFVPRGGVDLLTVYQSLLGALGFSVILEGWGKINSNQAQDQQGLQISGSKFRVLLIYILIYTFIGAYSYKYIDGKADLKLTEGDYQAMVWIRENTDQRATLMHLPAADYYESWWNDYFGEWMPIITERHNVVTVQGYEWLPGEFNDRIERYISLRSCVEQGESCVAEWMQTNQLDVDYVMLNKDQHSNILVADFLESPEYRIVHENQSVVILARHNR